METPKVRVLLVEDSPSDARLIQYELSQAEGHALDLTAVDTLAAALAKLNEQHFDVALVDLGLPDSAGFSTFARIQAECPQLPIVVLTGVQDEAAGSDAIRRGVQDYLIKGRADSRSLVRALRYAIERKRAEERLTKALAEAEEGRRLLQAIMDNVPEGIALVDGPDLNVRMISRFGQELLGAPLPRRATTLDVQPWTTYQLDGTTPMPEEAMPVTRAVRSGEVARNVRLVRKTTTGDQVTLLCNAAPIRGGNGEILGGVATWRDITEMQRAQEALSKARNELEQRVEERTADLAQTVEALHEEVARRTLAEDVLVRRSSQLRALASELTLAEQRERQRLAQLLHDGLQQLLVGAKYRLELLEQAKDKSLRQTVTALGGLISESIAACRSLTSELSPAILRAGGLLPALEWLVRWTKEKHGIDLQLNAPAAIDPTSEDVSVLLFQAIRELVFNAVKHARTKAVHVEVSQRNHELRVVVADSGAGFDPTQLRIGGGKAGGFGLFSIRERLDLMGGRLEIDSAPGQGSRLTLVAPLASTQANVAILSADLQARPSDPWVTLRRPLEERSRNRIRVMLVDDHVVMRQGVAHLLRGEQDMEVVAEASDGESAVTLARDVLPDVILMDISMPGQSGIATTAIIHAELPDVCIIGLSMFDAEEGAEAMRKAGATAYCAKDAPPASLIATIRKHAAMNDGQVSPSCSAERTATNAKVQSAKTRRRH